MQPLEWDAQDPAGSLVRWTDSLNEEARRQFLDAGTHLEIFFLFNGEGLMEVIPVVGMDKDDIVRELKQILAERDGYAFIHISEGTMRLMDSADKADMLLVHAESRDGLSVAYMSTVAMRGEEKLLLDTVKVDGKKLEGRFANIFQGL
jgi:hypothetical protein